MLSFTYSKFCLLLALGSLAHDGLADSSNDLVRHETPRIRRGGIPNLPSNLRVFQQRQEADPVVAEETDIAMKELMDSMLMSMDITLEPTTFPSEGPSGGPTSLTSVPTEATMPSAGPSASPVLPPSDPATQVPSSLPTTMPTSSPTVASTNAPSVPATQTGIIITDAPSTSPSQEPTSVPSTSPTEFPTTLSPTLTPTVEGCGISADVREALILEILDNAADPVAIRDLSTPQGQATEWLLNDDFRRLCPDTPKILQRWVLAVVYFSTGGNDWLQCSANLLANDFCGEEAPFGNKTRFLSSFGECEWAGIRCSDDLCVTEIEFGKYLVQVGIRNTLNLCIV